MYAAISISFTGLTGFVFLISLVLVNVSSFIKDQRKGCSSAVVVLPRDPAYSHFTAGHFLDIHLDFPLKLVLLLV